MEIESALSNLRLESAGVSGPLRFVRLVGPSNGPDAELLDESVAAGHTVVSEIGAEGMVNRVRIDDRGSRPLLLLDGEQIVGAKQNRILNGSFLIRPGASVEIPVSCVERGRWSYERARAPGGIGSATFDSSDTTLTARARSAKLRRVSASLDRGAGYDAHQSEVWRDVDSYLARTDTTSGSASFDDAYQRRRRATERGLDLLEPSARQVGIATICGRQLLSLEFFGSPSLYARSWRKIGRGLLAEHYESDIATSAEEAVCVAQQAVSALRNLETRRTSAPGGGETLHGSLFGLSLAALVVDGAVYHAVVAGEAV